MRNIPCAAMLLGLALASAAHADERLDRGRYLVETIAACGNCHTPRGADGPEPGKILAGGTVFDEDDFRAVASNITPDLGTGVGGWSDAEIARAVREGIRPDGTVIGPPMPIELYRHIADADLNAMVAYLRTVPAVSNKVEASRYDIPLPASYGPAVGHVAAPDRTDQIAYGAYLAGPVGHCIECHSPTLAGGQRNLGEIGWGGSRLFKGPWGVSVAPDITPTNLSSWSDEEIVRAITTGIEKGGGRMRPPMAFAYYQSMTQGDLAAIVAYLRSLPPSQI